MEAKSKGKTGDAINKLINLAPKTATVLRNGKEEIIGIENIVVGDIVIVKPGEKIAVDGIILDGKSSVDESSITGESIPIYKSANDKVISGTINKNGALKVEAKKVGSDTTLSQIIKLVEEASNSKAPISKLADRVSRVFVPIVISIAILAVIFWLLKGSSFEFALSIGIAVLVISCPCALGLATPVAIMVGTGKGAQNGILIKSAESLELLGKVDVVVFDKTGTVTKGIPKVTDIETNIDENELLKIAGTLEKSSEHPLAESILKKVKEKNLDLYDMQDFLAVSGRGIKGKIKNQYFYCGNISFLKENNISIENFSEKASVFFKDGKSVIYVANEKDIIGIIAVFDTIKPTSYKAIEELKKDKKEIVLLTGDNKVVANKIGEDLKIDKIISEVLPQDKENEISKLQKQGKKVAFVGDGINDSPALVRADVGLAIGSGTDIAIESADVVLIKDNLLDVVTAIKLSNAVIKNIKTNLFWAFFYNSIGIPISAGVFYSTLGLKLNPMIGALAMSLSSVCVVTNALRLNKFKISYKNINKKEEDKKMKIISIEGMQCNHCKMTVEKALNSIEGITKVDVNLENKNAIIEYEKDIEDSVIKNAVEEAGFEVKDIR